MQHVQILTKTSGLFLYPMPNIFCSGALASNSSGSDRIVSCFLKLLFTRPWGLRQAICTELGHYLCHLEQPCTCCLHAAEHPCALGFCPHTPQGPGSNPQSSCQPLRDAPRQHCPPGLHSNEEKREACETRRQNVLGWGRSSAAGAPRGDETQPKSPGDHSALQNLPVHRHFQNLPEREEK